MAESILINQPSVSSIIETVQQGLPGSVDYSLVFTINNRLAELDTEQKKADARARDNTQLGVYALAMKEITGGLPSRVGLFFLMNGIVGTFVPTESSLMKVRENIVKASGGIRAQEFSATPSKMDCENCPFSRYCDDSAV